MSLGCETALGQRNQSAGAIAAGTSPSSPYIPLPGGTWGLTASVTKLHYTTKALVSSLRIYGHLQVSILSTPYIQVHLFTVGQK